MMALAIAGIVLFLFSKPGKGTRTVFEILTAAPGADESSKSETVAKKSPTPTPTEDGGGEPEIDTVADIGTSTSSETTGFQRSDQELPNLSPTETAAVRTITANMLDYTINQKDPLKLVQALTDAGLHPVIAKDSNDSTGKMQVIRTTDALNGTRYIHAQLFDAADGKSFVQHYSFEIRAGSDSLETATEFLQRKMTDTKPSSRNENYISWKKNRYEIWCQRMGPEDLKGDFDNAHDPKMDVNTVRCAVELDPHS